MNTNQIVTSDELLVRFFTELELAGFEESRRSDITAYGVTTHYDKTGSAITVSIRLDEVSRAGIDDALSVTVTELDAAGWPTGVRHETSHLSARNLPAVVALITALAEAAI